MEKNRLVSLSNIVGKILEKGIYQSLYNHFAKFLKECHHGFVKQRSVANNMLVFLKKILDALDKESSGEIIAHYTDFSKTFAKVPHLELLKKLNHFGVAGCILEVISDYFDQRKEYVRVVITSSQLLDVASGVLQRSLVVPVLFCVFRNDLPAALKMSDPHMLAIDLNVLSIKNNWLKVQSDLNAVESWVKENKMTLTMDNCFKLTFSGDDSKFFQQSVALNSTKVIRDLRVYESDNLNWHAHISARLRKANSVFYLLTENISYKLQATCKLGLYKSLLLPVLTYGFYCASLSRAQMKRLEKLQNRVVQWITGSKISSYISQLRLFNLLQ